MSKSDRDKAIRILEMVSDQDIVNVLRNPVATILLEDSDTKINLILKQEATFEQYARMPAYLARSVASMFDVSIAEVREVMDRELDSPVAKMERRVEKMAGREGKKIRKWGT